MDGCVAPSQVDPPRDTLASCTTWLDIQRHLQLMAQLLVALNITLSAFALEVRQIDSYSGISGTPPYVQELIEEGLEGA